MKSHNWLLRALLHDCAAQCSVPPIEIARDLRTISNRVEKEGLSFLTITLPSFGSVIIRGVASGLLDCEAATGFSRRSGLPEFLRGFLSLVFDTNGRLREDYCKTSVACLHQICNVLKKIRMDCSKSRTEKAFRNFLSIDEAIPDKPALTADLAPSEGRKITLATFVRDFRVLFGDVLLPLDREIFEGEALPTRHGPGRTAERVVFNDKYRCTDWTERLDSVFFSDFYLQAFEGENQEDGPGRSTFSSYRPIDPGAETPVRVVAVPKTQKGPRIIAIEPVVMQHMQQGLLIRLTQLIKASYLGKVCVFDDQGINGRKALLASKDGFYATLDLKEASDRVPFWLVDEAFTHALPSTMEALRATRSRKANVPIPKRRKAVGEKSLVASRVGRQDKLSGGLLRSECVRGCCVSRAASCACDRSRVHGRGSATRHGDVPNAVENRPDAVACTARARSAPSLHVGGGPVEAPIIANGRTPGLAHGRQDRHSGVTIELRKFASMGSAVCFPVEAIVFTTIAIRGVADSRNLPLTHKTRKYLSSFVTVFGDDIIVPSDCAPTVIAYLEAFSLKVNREKSFWAGPFRESCGTDALDGEVITPAYLKTLQFGDRSSLDWLALWVEFSNTLYDKGYWETSRAVREKIASYGFAIPMVARTSPAIGYHNVRDTYEWSSWHTDYHKPMVKAYVTRSSKVDSELDGIAALRKTLGTSFNEDPNHLSRATRSSSVSTKKRWTPAY